jgi:hypothetical protein
MFVFSFSNSRRHPLFLALLATLMAACGCSKPVVQPGSASGLHAAAAPVRLPASTRLNYKLTASVKGMNYYADAGMSWVNEGDRYDVAMTISMLLLGSRSAASTGTIDAKGLAPLRYTDKFRTEQSTFFDAQAGTISFSAKTPTLPWVAGVQDRVSVFFQLGGMLAGHPAGFPVGSVHPVYIAGPRDAGTWAFRVEGEEKLTLPFGELTTVKLTRLPLREQDQKMEIWFAPSLGYLPVRNRITQFNGDFADQQLNGLSKG